MDQKNLRKVAAAGFLLAFAAAAQFGFHPSAAAQEDIALQAERAFAQAGLQAAQQGSAPAAPAPAPVQAPQPMVATWDLHTHTYYSDGLKSPEEVVRALKKAGVRYLAITDHDSVAGVARAQAEAKRQGVTLIPGIEISAEDDTIHILGLGINAGAQSFKDHMEAAGKERVARTKKILEALARVKDEDGRPIRLDLIEDILLPRLNLQRQVDGEKPLSAADARALGEDKIMAQLKGQVTRPDIARALIAKKYVQDNREAFDKYIGDGKPGGIPMDGPGFKKVVQMIHQAGGIAILAHPYTIFKFKKFPAKYSSKNYASFEDVAKDLLEAGLDGFEAFRPGYERYPKDNARVKDIVDKYIQNNPQSQQLMTAGSDYHGYDQGGIGPRAPGGVSITQGVAGAMEKRLKP